MTRSTGICAMGANCTHPEQQLIDEHECPRCKKILHILCGDFDFETDKYVCKIDCRKKANDNVITCVPIPASQSKPPSKVVAQPNKPPPTTVACSSCGRLDHQRSSNKKCLNYKPKKKRSNENNDTNNNPTKKQELKMMLLMQLLHLSPHRILLSLLLTKPTKM